MNLNRWFIACAASLAVCSTALATLGLEFSASGGADPASNTTADSTNAGAAAGFEMSNAVPVNSAPEISGPTSGNALVGVPFSLRPTASDPDGDALTFSFSNLPAWASFDPATGVLFGTPQATDAGVHAHITISVSDGTYKVSLPEITVTVVAPPRKDGYGQYFAAVYADTPTDAVKSCEQPGASGVVWRQAWQQVEPAAELYDFSSFDQVLAAIAASANPSCQLWLLVEYKSSANSPVKNPCPVYLQARHSGLNSAGNGAATCFMWEPELVNAYVDMMWAAAAHFDQDPRVEGLILQGTSLGLNGAYSQGLTAGGPYTPVAWRDALITLATQCSAAFADSRCVTFLNSLDDDQSNLDELAAAISAIPGNQACFTGPDVLSDASYAVASAVCSGGTPVNSGTGGLTSGSTGNATLSWQAPVTNTDGTPLTDLAGYYIHYGTDIVNLDQQITIGTVGTLSYVIENLASGTYYFALSSYTTAGVESELSVIVSKTI